MATICRVDRAPAAALALVAGRQLPRDLLVTRVRPQARPHRVEHCCDRFVCAVQMQAVAAQLTRNSHRVPPPLIAVGARLLRPPRTLARLSPDGCARAPARSNDGPSRASKWRSVSPLAGRGPQLRRRAVAPSPALNPDVARH